MLSRFVSPTTDTAPASSRSRADRIRSCSGDSSPEAYSVRIPLRSSRAAACSNNVDLPMPGSPPTSTSEPGTMPPPRTKSNSSRPVCQRATSIRARSESRMGGWTDGTIRRFAFVTGSSASVFQAPHASQRPAHFGCSAPHSVHRNTEEALDTALLRRGVPERPVVEARVFLLEVERHGPRRSIALFSHDQLGQSLDAVAVLVGRALVHLLPVDEAHEIGVLLDGARLPQIRKLRPPAFPGALLRGA